GVEVHRLEHELHGDFFEETRVREHSTPQDSIVSFNTPMLTPREIPAGSYIVFLAQPQRANVLALFERQVYPDRRTASGEAERPYDVAGWTLPMQLGVQALPVHSITEPEAARRLTLIRDENEVRRDLALPLRQGKGSPLANPITRPVRLALYKSWTAAMGEGWTRYVFDTFNVPYTSLLDKEVRAGDLRAKYDVIVLPSLRL